MNTTNTNSSGSTDYSTDVNSLLVNKQQNNDDDASDSDVDDDSIKKTTVFTKTLKMMEMKKNSLISPTVVFPSVLFFCLFISLTHPFISSLFPSIISVDKRLFILACIGTLVFMIALQFKEKFQCFSKNKNNKKK
jgi:hypothetical protein